MPEQLTFDLTTRESRDSGDFFVSSANALAVKRLEDPETWPNLKLALVGSEGAGKTHLAHVWKDTTNGRLITPVELDAIDILEVTQPVVLDDADKLKPHAEESLFHLHNHLANAKIPFLLTARTPPVQWPIALPDLKSRIAATDLVRIDAPDDKLLAAVMLKLFSDRQLSVAPNVISLLVDRMDRSFGGAQKMVELLDRAALSEGRAVTRPLAMRVLARLDWN